MPVTSVRIHIHFAKKIGFESKTRAQAAYRMPKCPVRIPSVVGQFPLNFSQGYSKK